MLLVLMVTVIKMKYTETVKRDVAGIDGNRHQNEVYETVKSDVEGVVGSCQHDKAERDSTK